jgi:hypothetical protein
MQQWEYKWVPVTREWMKTESGEVRYGTWEMAGTDKTGPKRIDAMNDWGREGWELVIAVPGSTVDTRLGPEAAPHEINSIGYTFVFKRPIPQAIEAAPAPETTEAPEAE